MIKHYGAVRLRATGTGTLHMTLFSLDSVRSSALPNTTLSSTTNREVFKLANFTEERAQLEIKTTAIDERFSISKIIVFTRPIAVEYPA